jgi:hypothetical protein
MNLIISMLCCCHVFILIPLKHCKCELNSIKCIVSYVHHICVFVMCYTSNFLKTDIVDVSIINDVGFHFLQQFVSALFSIQTSHTFIVLQLSWRY